MLGSLTPKHLHADNAENEKIKDVYLLKIFKIQLQLHSSSSITVKNVHSKIVTVLYKLGHAHLQLCTLSLSTAIQLVCLSLETQTQEEIHTDTGRT